jgi:hypothetical protein
VTTFRSRHLTSFHSTPNSLGTPSSSGPIEGMPHPSGVPPLPSPGPCSARSTTPAVSPLHALARRLQPGSRACAQPGKPSSTLPFTASVLLRVSLESPRQSGTRACFTYCVRGLLVSQRVNEGVSRPSSRRAGATCAHPAEGGGFTSRGGSLVINTAVASTGCEDCRGGGLVTGHGCWTSR